MDLAEIKDRIKPRTTEHGTVIHMLTLEEGAWLIAEVERLNAKCEERRDMLEDVVNELDLSDGVIDEHGPLGTAPATLVRLVLERKDREIAMLKSGMTRISTT